MIKPEILDAMVASGCTAEQIAAVVKASMSSRSSNAERQARFRAKRKTQQGVTSNESNVTGVTVTDVVSPKKETSPTPPKEKTTPSTISEANASSISLETEFEQQFWPAYPRRVGKGQALKAFRAARKQSDLETIMAGIRRYAASRQGENPEYTKHASTWLNGQCWLDEADPKFSAHRSDPPYRRGESATDIWRDELIERGILRDEPDSHQSSILDVGHGGGYFEGNVHPLRIASAGSK
ncbi:hypothetical protein [Ochrobactrum chromiisoli]|uniref:Uncharacterized protein n=1 Tax=Ochrobactrum chromiisoli TaxID=2993941 RepID=A0ABT3QV25_9HYPH|nr:hypothetical protein [Ochrobactrum chromiisoli]MCX2699472.1 hypothetical protein [Ochrobactrum chromiisoli]